MSGAPSTPDPFGGSTSSLPSVFDFQDYPSFLRAVLDRRQRRNRAYSLRSFARALAIPASYLSDVLRARKNFSPSRAAEIAQRLGLESIEREAFLLRVQLATVGASPALEASLNSKLNSLRPREVAPTLDLDLFATIADWQHVAILEMLDLPNFNPDAAALAARLNLGPADAREAFERLQRVGLIEQDEQGHWRKSQRRGLFVSDAPNAALRRFHRQMLDKARESVDSQLNAQKFVGSQTFAFDSKQMPRAKEIIEECFERLSALVAQSPQRDEVYHFGAQLFRLSQTTPPEEIT